MLTFCQSENIGYYMNKVRRVMCSESKSFQRWCWHRVSFFFFFSSFFLLFFEKKKSRACWLAGLNGILKGFNSRKLKCNRQMRSGIVLVPSQPDSGVFESIARGRAILVQ